jgi:hypothetical protein
MRSFKHLTPRYIWNRLGLMAYEWANPDVPWLTPDIIKILDGWLLPKDVGLEFGSGRSTIWFAQRVGHLTSVEDNPEWYSIVKNRIQKGYANVDYLFHQSSSSNAVNSGYVDVARQMRELSLDFCLVDGNLRDHCALSSLDKIRSGGILIIDNVERYMPRRQKSFSPNSRNINDGYETETWAQVGEQIKTWRCIWTTNGVSDTAFWVKP